MLPHYKGIILAGGTGSRLQPLTFGVSKQLLPVYDKPMIYYPISVLMLADIRDILIICTPQDLQTYKRLLGTGEQFGIDIRYATQSAPRGLAEAFIIGADFVGDNPVALVLGDNLFYGDKFPQYLKQATSGTGAATIFAYYVQNPSSFGVVEFDSYFKAVALAEKPEQPISNFAVTGLYFYDNSVLEKARRLKPSSRGELEITDINSQYLAEGGLDVTVLGRGFAWLDTGTTDSLLEAGQFVRTIEQRQGLKIACLEEIAFSKGWLTLEQLKDRASLFGASDYGLYLRKICSG